jgi:threonine/homoserine/homoserine lactone efflux protein
MNGIIELFLLGFFVGLTGALAPGPTLIATINASLKGGWTMGPRVTLGHAVVEIVMVLLIIAGISVLVGKFSWVITLIGGLALTIFGIITILEGRHAKVDISQQKSLGIESKVDPFLAGILTSVSNPYFWLWWLTVGSALMIGALSGGISTAIAFIGGHWTADLGWFTLVSVSVHKGKFLLGEREYQWTLTICGVFLLIFGSYYLTTLLG